MRESRRTGLMKGWLIYSVGNCCKPQAQHQRRKKVRVRKNRSSSKWGRGEREKAEIQNLSALKARQRHYSDALLFSWILQSLCTTTSRKQTFPWGKKGPISCFSSLRASPHYPALVHSARSHSSVTLITTLFTDLRKAE